MLFNDTPEPTGYMPCYMVTPAHEIVDLSFMCGKRKTQPEAIAESRVAFIERMARLQVQYQCADPLMGLSGAGEIIAREVVGGGYDVGIYVEISTRAVELKPENCL